MQKEINYDTTVRQLVISYVWLYVTSNDDEQQTAVNNLHVSREADIDSNTSCNSLHDG